MSRSIRDSVVLITGASAGIGAALARELHARGARLVLAARRLDRLEALNAELGGRHLSVAADVASDADCARIVDEAVRHFGRIDTLVCNAGYGLVRQVAETSDEEHLAMYRTNVIGTVGCLRATVPHLRRNEIRDGYRGQIVIVSSAAARRGLPFFGVYSATKAAQLSLAEAARAELAVDRIAVTSVHPIGTDTDFFTSAEKLSSATLDVPGRSPIRQSASRVARTMARAIERPRPEVWPFRPSRVALLLGSLMPRLTDVAMRRMAAKVAAAQAPARAS